MGMYPGGGGAGLASGCKTMGGRAPGASFFFAIFFRLPGCCCGCGCGWSVGARVVRLAIAVWVGGDGKGRDCAEEEEEEDDSEGDVVGCAVGGGGRAMAPGRLGGGYTAGVAASGCPGACC